MCDTSKKSMIESFGTLENMKSHFSMIPNVFGITPHLILSSNCGVLINKNPLFLGVDMNNFKNKGVKNKVENLVFIGSLIKRKNLNDILNLAKYFKNLTFNIIGDGPLKDELENKSTTNVNFFGELNSYEISNHLQNMDLHILLSRSEGFPKVILETASSAIPSILYDDYGADSWINHLENGFVVSSFEEVKSTIDNLIENPKLLIRNSENVLELAEKFDWKIIIKSWEKVIDNLK
jgi:glycosyltransferase involved in cell wall biosynthesis